MQAEPHLKAGTQTVGELGPDKLGDLNPGQEATSSVSVSSEPSLAEVFFDGYVIHMEVFDCGGPGPVPHTGGEGAEGGAGEGAGGEGHGSGGEEGSGANQLAPDETFDMIRSGARLILNYDAASNSFKGTVENTTSDVLEPGQDRGTPIERNGARSDDSGGHGSEPGAGGHPALDAGILHRMGSTCRGWRRR